MKTPTKSVLSAASRKPLAACCAVVFALAAPEAFATNTWPVTNCSDHDPGSLRDVVSNISVVSDDTVDLSNLTCSEISLTTGAISINQNTLFLQGPTSHRLAIDMPTSPPVPDTLLYHTGTGTLFVEDLYLSSGYGHPDSTGKNRFGGCIDSAGSVTLSNSQVVGCQAAQGTGGDAQGGGIRTQHDLSMFHSRIAFNGAGYASGATSSDFVSGGGASVPGNFIAKYSTIENNSAVGHYTTTNQTGIGGGVTVSGNTIIIASTIANNWASTQGGGIEVLGFSTGNVSITNSTISGNSAASGGGVLIYDSPTVIRNSTIAFNRNTTNQGLGAGVKLEAIFNSFTADLQSSIVSNNGYKLSANKYVQNDIGVFDYTNKNNTTYSATISGANNLVYAADSSVGANGLPPDTIKGACPLLGPLKNNGGETKTHALASGSPAIDVGNNTGRENYDQRNGPTPPPIAQPPLGYPRVSGMAADIGAYEVQQSDSIFNNSFENGGCS